MFLLYIILLTSIIFPKWNKLVTPKNLSNLENITSGNDFIVGASLMPFFSFDGGETWELRNNGLPEDFGTIDKLVVDDDIVYVLSSVGSLSLRSDFYFTIDKGMNWNKVGENQNYTNHRILNDLKVENGTIYVLPYSFRSIIKSTDFGETWDTLGLWDKNINYMNYLDVKNDTIVVADAGAIGSSGPVNSGVIVSIDGGKTWEKRNNGLGLGNITCLKIHKNNIFVGTKDGFYFSENFGESYKRAGSIIYNTYINEIEIVDDTVYIATEFGLFKALNLWKEWVEIPQFKLQFVNDIHYKRNNLFVSSRDRDYSNYYSYLSQDKNHFKQLNFIKESTLSDFLLDYPNLYFSTYNFTQNYIYSKSKIDDNNSIIYDENLTKGLYSLSKYNKSIIARIVSFSSKGDNNQIILSSNNGVSWKTIKLNNEKINIRTVLLLKEDTIFVASNDSLYISSDFGENWGIFKTEDFVVNENLSKIINIKRINGKIYFYGSGRILETDDQLSYWKPLLNITHNEYNREIFNISKFRNSIFSISFKGNLVEPSTIDFSRSTDEGKTWENIENRFNDYNDIRFLNVYNIEDYVFVGTTSGVFYSKDNGDSFEEINDGISNSAMSNGKEFYIYDDKLVYCSGGGIFHRDLEELGITLTSVEKTEQRNYLYTFPPFPQPTKQEVKISTYWDSALPFTADDVEIYNLAGIKINTENKLSINKETNYKGHIIWDTSGEQAGIYIVNIKHGTETRMQKVMVEK